jgi:hypothetical protein
MFVVAQTERETELTAKDEIIKIFPRAGKHVELTAVAAGGFRYVLFSDSMLSSDLYAEG